MMTLGVVMAVFAVVVLYFILTYNEFIRLRNKVEEAFATMDVYMKKRWDLIPNLVETVKGYATHEQETLAQVIQARNLAMNSSGQAERQANENALVAGLKSVFALSEAYPDLKANQSFVNLQDQLQEVEDDIMQSRKYFNAIVKAFNTKRELFPASLVAAMMTLTKREYFEIERAERANVAVKF
jgi:LemA protein